MAKAREKQTVAAEEVGEMPAGIIEPREVRTTFALSGARRTATSKEIEDAMLQASRDATAEGIVDPDVQRARMLQAREDVKARIADTPPSAEEETI